jgi:hypothetical protein
MVVMVGLGGICWRPSSKNNNILDFWSASLRALKRSNG